jgi:ABC-type glycerol-3-phosphate transport system permease component
MKAKKEHTARKFKISTLAAHLILIIGSLISIYPIYIMLIDTLKSGTELTQNIAGWPQNFTLENYINILSFNGSVIPKTFFNSVFVATCYTVITLFIASLAAFAFSKFRFKYKRFWFMFFLITMMVPVEVNISPLFLMFSKLGWLNTYIVQILPGIANVLAMYMYRNYMMSIPDSIVEAARIDGASHIQIYRKVIMPMCTPVTGSLAIIMFMTKWNDYILPKLLIDKTETMPIMVLLPQLKEDASSYVVPWEVLLTGCAIVMVPMIIVFFAFQDKFMESVSVGAVKE